MKRLETLEYSVDFDPSKRSIRIALRGHWSPEVAKRYDREFREAIREMPAGGCPLGQQLVYLDAREFAVQSQEVLVILERLSNDPATAAKRTAVVASSALLTMQAHRVVPNFRVFSDPQTALEWLDTGIEGAA